MLTYSFLKALFAIKHHNHDDRYYQQATLQTSGLAQVHWENISNAPFLEDEINGNEDDGTYDGGL